MSVTALNETNYPIIDSRSETLDLDDFKVPVRILTYGLDMFSGLSFEEMLRKGEYDKVSEDINLENFPPGFPRPGVSRIHHLWFDKKLSDAQLSRALYELEFEAAVIPELAVFGLTCPNLQYRGPIVALGSTWCRKPNDVRVPCLTNNGSDRVFTHTWNDCWNTGHSFLAVDK